MKTREHGNSKKSCRTTEVYFVHEIGMGAIKIGITGRGVDDRIQRMVTNTPHILTLLAVIEGDRKFETELHFRFASARIRGEWFRPVPELLAYIEEVKRLPVRDIRGEMADLVSSLIPSTIKVSSHENA
jgi:hypothetical protein